MGSQRGKILAQLHEAIVDGALKYNAEVFERLQGQNSGAEAPEDPLLSLRPLYEQWKTFGVLPEAGGLNDQFFYQITTLLYMEEASRIIERQNSANNKK